MIQNPYSVLGVSENASEEEIAKAYKALVKKYHPDLHPGDKAAEQKMSEINAAYDLIKSGGWQSYSDSSSGSDYSRGYSNPFEGGYSGSRGYSGSPRYAHIRECINAGEYAMALQYLTQTRERTAEWYYLSAVANSGVGNTLTAFNHARQAVELEPDNIEYRRLLNLLGHGGRVYEQESAQFGTPCSCPKMCMWLCLAQLCCSTLGGGCNMCLGGSNAGAFYR